MKQVNIETSKKPPLPRSLQELEDEAIFVIREVYAEADNPVCLYSIGKDSSVLTHLISKAFYPGRPAIPLLHIDTTWKFREMIDFRDRRASEMGFDLIVHVNEQGLREGVNPFDHGSSHYTTVMKTQALLEALKKYRFDCALGGARRDEEKSRAKERIFSLRQNDKWDPRHQRPEMWRAFNLKLGPGQSMRVFPMSNWTELDVWLYIYLEEIPVVPLYFSRRRPVVERDGALIMADDDRLPLQSPAEPKVENIRFRTLGCYPLTGAIRSEATDVREIIIEILSGTQSERHNRLIDRDQRSSMQRKKREGYF